MKRPCPIGDSKSESITDSDDGGNGMLESDNDGVDMNTSVASDAPPWTQSTVDSISSDPTSEDRHCFFY